jgi:hypothetical protein
MGYNDQMEVLMYFLLNFLVFCMSSIPLFSAPDIEKFLMGRETQVSVSAESGKHLLDHSFYENMI